MCVQLRHGTGKTRAAIEAIRHKLAHAHLDVVVVACPKGVMPYMGA